MIDGMSKAGIEIDRKVLSDIAIFDKPTFAKIADQAKAAFAK
jgi:large subunit ribosomal protein L20